MSETTSKKRKLSLPLVLAGSVSSLVLALGMSPTFSAFSASITNSANTAGTGTLIMEESSAGTSKPWLSTDGPNGLSGNAATCASINKYGGTGTLLTPGGAANITTVTIKNVGKMAATSFSLTPGECEQSTLGASNGTAKDLCKKLHIKITTGSTPVYDGPADAFNKTLPLTPLAAGASADYTFAVSLDSIPDATVNSYQGLQASQPLTWTFQA